LSFTFDANVLLHASDETSAYHPRARGFLDELARGDELVICSGRPSWRISGSLRLRPSSRSRFPAEAVANIERLLALPHVQTTGEQDRFWASYRRVAAEGDARGNLVSDAHDVALMVENGVRTIWTRDRDYRRFAGIEARDPFA
jgi:uncharacterized protein